MEALKWAGYLLAAIAVLSVIAGVITLVFTAVIIGGAILTITSVVAWTAMYIKGFVESNKAR